MKANPQWRKINKPRKSQGVLKDFCHDFFSLLLSLPVASIGMIALLTVTAASQPGSRLPQYLTFGLNRYAYADESATSGTLRTGSVIPGFDCGKGSNTLADKHVVKSTCIPGAIEAAKTSSGSYVRTWMANARLAGESISTTAEWYRKRYLGGYGHNR
jgi:hypothetical protein